jgi:hypothetical protein
VRIFGRAGRIVIVPKPFRRGRVDPDALRARTTRVRGVAIGFDDGDLLLVSS